MKTRLIFPPFILFLFSTLLSARAGLLVLANDPVVWQFNDSTGALVGGAGGTGAETLEGETIGPDGNIYVTGNTLGYGDVYRFDRSGNYLGKFNANSTNGNLSFPGNLTFGPDGNCYVVGGTNLTGNTASLIRRFNGATGLFIDDFVTNVNANALAFGGDGNLYVADADRGIVRYDGNTGAYLDTFVPLGTGGLADVRHFIFGPDGDLYVCSWTSNAVFRFDGGTGQFMDTFVASGSGGLNEPTGLTFGIDGNFYVLSYTYASSGSGAILQYDGQTGAFLKVFATNNTALPPSENRALVNAHDLIFLPPPLFLNIQAGHNGTVLISWPVAAGTGWALTRRNDCHSTGRWQVLTNIPAIVGTNYVVTDQCDQPTAFYRLQIK